jgi:transcriptional regulator with GAF, ATPase, and Fis domain
MGFRARLAALGRTHARTSVPMIDWRTLIALRPNIMIEGQESDVEKTLVALTGDFRAGTCEWSAFEQYAAAPIATIVVREVTRLSALDLLRLTTFLNTMHPRVQLIVTSSTPVFRAVQQGRFPADLYYRLNTVMLTDAQRSAA